MRSDLRCLRLRLLDELPERSTGRHVERHLSHDARAAHERRADAAAELRHAFDALADAADHLVALVGRELGETLLEVAKEPIHVAGGLECPRKAFRCYPSGAPPGAGTLARAQAQRSGERNWPLRRSLPRSRLSALAHRRRWSFPVGVPPPSKSSSSVAKGLCNRPDHAFSDTRTPPATPHLIRTSFSPEDCAWLLPFPLVEAPKGDPDASSSPPQTAPSSRPSGSALRRAPQWRNATSPTVPSELSTGQGALRPCSV